MDSGADAAEDTVEGVEAVDKDKDHVPTREEKVAELRTARERMVQLMQ